MTAPSSAPQTGDSAARSLRRGLTVRTRMLSTMLLFMAVGLAMTGALSYAIQFHNVEERVRSELWQEQRELTLVAEAKDADGDPLYGTVEELLRAVTQSAYPSNNEAVLTTLNGKPRYEPADQDFDLTDPEVLAQIEAATEPGRTVITTLDVDGTEVRALIATIDAPEDDATGTFIVGIDVGVQKAQVWRSVGVFTLMSLLTLAIAGWVGYLVTGRLLAPLASLRRATEEITADELERRVEVPQGRDDISALARNFNRMLERIQSGFREQQRFMSDVGHELRTPLTIVRGTLEMTDVEDPEDVRDGHEIAMDELDRMGRVVGDLSELAAAARPHFIRPRTIRLSAFSDSVFQRIEKIDDRDWVFAGAEDVEFTGDDQRLTQAIIQLAANAVRYSDEGSTIAFGARKVAGAVGPEIHLAVRDEGIGIAPEDQARVFERFARIDTETDRSGSGLGLSIVQAIARGHGGDVRLESQVGVGSTFTVVIPQHPRPFTDTEDTAS